MDVITILKAVKRDKYRPPRPNTSLSPKVEHFIYSHFITTQSPVKVSESAISFSAAV
jgi:hypothetical protein